MVVTAAASNSNGTQVKHSPVRAVGGIHVDPVVPVNPILSYEPVDSPSTSNQAGASSNAPFAQKVADMISKKREPPVDDDVYGLEQSAISGMSAAQPLNQGSAPKQSVSIMSSLVGSPNLKILTNSNEKNISARLTTSQ